MPETGITPRPVSNKDDMLYCEDCRKESNWPMPATYPFHTEQKAKCERCGKIKSCYDVPFTQLKPKSELTATEKAMELVIQDTYRAKAENLAIYHVDGQNRGRLDTEKTEDLKKIFVKRGDVIDWRATYELRLKAQIGHYRAEELKRNRR